VTIPIARPATARSAATIGNHQFRALVALAAIGAGGVAVLGLWWQDTPSITGLGAWLTNAGRISGLIAGYTLAILLMLMSRAPVLEHGLGADVLARWHARGGRYAVSLIVVHALLITWGYAVTAHTDVLSQTGSFLVSYPDVLMATVAALMLVGVGIASARATRERLRYETWYYLHLYTYLAVALAFSHQFATGADFATNLPARAAWTALYLVAIGMVVWYRLVMPVLAAWRHQLRIIEIRPESADTVSISIAGRSLGGLRAESGQFFRWRFLSRDHWWQSHPYSLSAAPDGRTLRITVKALGDHSAGVGGLRVGTRVLAEGPYGALTTDRRRRCRVLLLAGGVGITPLRALFESLPAGPGELTLVVRANRHDDVVLRAELDQIAARKRARVHYLIGPPGSDADPFVGRRLSQLVPRLAQHDVFVCGPPGFMTVAYKQLTAAGVPRRFIHQEFFAF
jgi:predicted ferric reductase